MIKVPSYITNWDMPPGTLEQTYPILAIDAETVSLENKLVLGIGISWDGVHGVYFLNPRDPRLIALINRTDQVVVQNGSFDIPELRKMGCPVPDFDDTMLMARAAGILEASLEALSASVLGRECPSVTDQWDKDDKGRLKQHANIGIDHEFMGQICIIHACNTMALHKTIPKTELYETIDKPFLDLVIEMESWGLLIDQWILTQVEHSEAVQANQLRMELYMDMGVINFSSTKQVAEALRAKGIIGTRKTKSDKMSTSSDSLKGLDNPITNRLLKWRSKKKTLSTYIPAFRNVDERGRLHTHFGYATTGRLRSYSEGGKGTNLQNITKDSKFKEDE